MRPACGLAAQPVEQLVAADAAAPPRFKVIGQAVFGDRAALAGDQQA
jgi:hypothetical protein